MNAHQSPLNQVVIYQKSLEVFKLSRHIANYITFNKNILDLHRSSKKEERYMGKIILDSIGLVPKIARTELEPNPRKKLKYARSLSVFIDRIYCNSKRLEASKIPGKDFVKLLRRELIQLREMHMHYVNSLL